MIILNELKNIVDEFSINENFDGGVHSHGSFRQRERIEKVCELALQNYDGDILEIGCHIGLTTIILCELAKKYNRKVIILDPWNGQQQGNDEVYQVFLHNTSNYKDILQINRLSSFSAEGKEVIKNNKFAFCWVDGLHTRDACSQDIDSCSGNKAIIAVDDLKWLPELKNLFFEKSQQYGFITFYNESCREGYYINE